MAKASITIRPFGRFISISLASAGFTPSIHLLVAFCRVEPVTLAFAD